MLSDLRRNMYVETHPPIIRRRPGIDNFKFANAHEMYLAHAAAG